MWYLWFQRPKAIILSSKDLPSSFSGGSMAEVHGDTSNTGRLLVPTVGRLPNRKLLKLATSSWGFGILICPLQGVSQGMKMPWTPWKSETLGFSVRGKNLKLGYLDVGSHRWIRVASFASTGYLWNWPWIFCLFVRSLSQRTKPPFAMVFSHVFP